MGTGNGGGQGSEDCHSMLRQRTIAFMRENQSHFRPFMEDDEDFDQYCTRMEVITLSSISKLLSCFIVSIVCSQNSRISAFGRFHLHDVGIIALLPHYGS